MNKPRIVYDVDDTLWNLNETACKVANIDVNKITVYSFNKNPNLTPEEKERLLEAYSSPAVFRLCNFYEGHDRIFDLEQSGEAEVWISSANLSENIISVKLSRLKSEIPNINMQQVAMTCKADTTAKVTDAVYQGRVPGDILVDDSMLNIINGEFKYNILIDKLYNREDGEKLLDETPDARNKNIIRVPNLMAAIELVEKIVRNQ